MNKNTKDKDIENQETEINVEDGDNVSEEILLEDETTELEEVKSDEDIIKDLEDQVLRAKAEVQNVRRIAAQEVTKARLFGVEALAKEFLSVSDNLERAVISCEDSEEINVIKEGLELTLKSLESSLSSAGIKAIEFNDKSFDPERHEAISVIEDDTLEQNTIIDVVQKGYTIMDRILRPSKVVVSKKSQKNH
ncbi:MAG: nucleotide exchange factor GrpE [Gammaproteobacteria bacterium]|nr:MAG: nucleotide exchange factor GrpE [Gammaproteobacteria bacterium]